MAMESVVGMAVEGCGWPWKMSWGWQWRGVHVDGNGKCCEDVSGGVWMAMENVVGMAVEGGGWPWKMS